MFTQEKKQELFDKAVRGLHSQGYKRSMVEGTSMCAYNGKCGDEVVHCAVGWLITDVEIPEEQNTRGISSLTISVPETKTFLGMDDTDNYYARTFLGELQGAHDASSEPEEMKQRLQALARYEGLTFPADCA